MKYESAFPRYSAYRYSCVEWLGCLPEHWSIKIVKRTTYLKGRVGWKGLTSDEFLEDGYAHLVTGTDFVSKLVDWSKCHCVDQGRHDDDPFIQLRDGDLLITKDGTIGKLALVANLQKPACLNSGIFLVRPLNSYTTEYLYWVLSSSVFGLFCDLSSLGSTIQHLYQNVFENFAFPVPPFAEQRAIAAFLDRETARIDSVIGKQERLINLLIEKRQAVISHAVTKGLDPSVKVKDTGIEWLGHVPEHWELLPIKRIALLKSGETITSDSIAEVGEYPVYGGNGTRGFTGGHTHTGDYALIGRQGALCGNINYASGRFWASEHAIVASPIKKVVVLWLGELLRTMNLNQYSVSAAQPGLSVDVLNDLLIPYPPYGEQRVIAAFLTKETAKIDALIEKASQSIELMKERRSALISAVVTGKIDVREAA